MDDEEEEEDKELILDVGRLNVSGNIMEESIGKPIIGAATLIPSSIVFPRVLDAAAKTTF